MQLGFSIVGAVFLAMLFVPNIKWAQNQPAGYSELTARENRILLGLERAGQVATTCSAVVFVCPKGFSFPWVLWLCAALLCMVLYEMAWTRYFRNGERLADMYAPLGPISVPIASLPVAAFVLLGVWYQSPVAVASAVVLGIGHIGIHLCHLRDLAS